MTSVCANHLPAAPAPRHILLSAAQKVCNSGQGV